jgi:hypothetical protein
MGAPWQSGSVKAGRCNHRKHSALFYACRCNHAFLAFALYSLRFEATREVEMFAYFKEQFVTALRYAAVVPFTVDS